MIKILITEDEDSKRQLLTNAILEIKELSIESITVVSDVREAKIQLSKTKFDLLILDINLPIQVDRVAEKGGGLKVLNFIKTNLKAKAPTYIIGMTAYDEAVDIASNDFDSPIWKLVKFSHSDLQWKNPLQNAIRYLKSIHKPPYYSDGSTYHTDIGIVVALSEELHPILSLPFSWKSLKLSGDPTEYHEGSIIAGERTISIVACACPKMGMPAAGAIASKLIFTFRPKYLLSSGICAGVREKTKIGDILIADPCFDWGSGKWKIKKDSSTFFHAAAYQWRVDSSLMSIAQQLSSTKSVMEQIYRNYETSVKLNTNIPEVLIDTMASGGSVLQSTTMMSRIRDMHKNLIGVEMENYAIFSAAEYSAEPRPKYISFKSVCDFGDNKKSDKFHEYAAYVSANFMHAYINEMINDGLFE